MGSCRRRGVGQAENGRQQAEGAMCAEAGSMRATVHSGTTETRNVGGAGSWQEMNLETGVGSSRGKAGACSEARLTGFLLPALADDFFIPEPPGKPMSLGWQRLNIPII